MTKIRVLIFLLTLVVMSVFGTFVSFYARGYRFDTKKVEFVPNGILVLKSDPDGASVYINGDLRAATNSTLSLLPGTYDVTIKKDGYFSWQKRIQIQKEVVTQTNVSLFRSAPSLSPITFSGATNPIVSNDTSKLAFSVLPENEIPEEKVGLWVIDTLNLPLGFAREPRRITDGNMKDSTYQFSPDGRGLLISSFESVYLLETGSFTSQKLIVNVSSKKQDILTSWEKEKELKTKGLVSTLNSEVSDMLLRKTSNLVFSPDENKILYTASAEATLRDNLIPQLPGASTQKQERSIKKGSTYIYDVKEDRNFLISDSPVVLDGAPNNLTSPLPAIHWFPTSNHIIKAEESKISLVEYDGTNSVTVFSGNYLFPSAFPYLSTNKILVLTNLGSTASPANIYSLSLK